MKTRMMFVTLASLALMLFLSIASPSHVSQAASISDTPVRAHCGALIAGVPASQQPCQQYERRKLLEWHGSPSKASPMIATPLRWVLYVRCEASKGIMSLAIVDAQMPLVQEQVACDGKWHKHVYYPLEDTVWFVVNKPAEIQVWA